MSEEKVTGVSRHTVPKCSAPERPVLRYFGGKWRIAPWIIGHFPTHETYCEPFGGAASVLLRKPRSHIEVYNDLDDEIVNVFRVLQSPALAAELERKIRVTPFARREFDLAYEITVDPVERARRALVRGLFGHGAVGINRERKTGFRAATPDIGVPPCIDWVNYGTIIGQYTSRLMGVVIENRDANEVMRQQDRSDTLHFVDPPYVHETRGAVDEYRCEMTDAQHVELCEVLLSLKGMVILCGYENSIYERLGWECVRREARDGVVSERIEVLWLNPACVAAQSQGKLL